MPQRAQALLEPRKRPIQARSAASVEAILEATIQVLLQVGKDRLTTTRVALRAGVSVGTLYQYFPNKSALLKAALKRHMDEVSAALDRACREQEGNTLAQMVTALINAFLEAKMKNVKTSVALYSVSSDVDGAAVVKQVGIRMTTAIVGLLATAREPLKKDPRLVAAMLQGAMAGVSRRLLESDSPPNDFDALRQELFFSPAPTSKPVPLAHPQTQSATSPDSGSVGSSTSLDFLKMFCKPVVPGVQYPT